MTVDEFNAEWFDEDVDALVMIKDKETGKLFSVKGISREFHADGPTGETVWIEVEEY